MILEKEGNQEKNEIKNENKVMMQEASGCRG